MTSPICTDSEMAQEMIARTNDKDGSGPGTDLLPLLLGGERVVGSGTAFESVNPATGRVNYSVSAASADDVDTCVRIAAEAARRPEWRMMRPHARSRILAAIADGMTERAEELAITQSRENGKLMSECRAQAASAAATFRYYAGVCETVGSEVTPSRGDYLSMTTYEPIGVVAAITPWNSPLTMEAQKIAPALAAGNAVIVKPSEVTPSTALIVGEIALAAGLPPGLLNVLNGSGRETGSALVQHPGVRMVTFTGGTETGRSIAQIAAARLIPAALELGGKSPHIVFADADLEHAASSVIGGIFEGTGQSCVAGSRLFVQRECFEPFLAILKKRTQELQVGLPESADSQMGPLASHRQRETVEAFVASARADGGTILTGGERPEDPALAAGAFYLPTLITGLNREAKACSEEIFGPVLCILPFDDEEDLIAAANETSFGLASGIWTADYNRALRVASGIEAGTVWINTYKQLSISTPFGGYKESGLGREKSIGGMRLYQQTKSIYLGGVQL